MTSRGEHDAKRHPGFGSIAEETSSCPYRHDRDLTGFIDGSENPSLIDAPERGEPGRRRRHDHGIRDALTNYTRPITGAYFVPAAETLPGRSRA